MSPSIPVNATPEDWFILQANACFGPFSQSQVARLIVARRVDKQARLRRGDWQDWRDVAGCLHELAEDAASRKAREPFQRERRMAAPRTSVSGEFKLLSAKGTVVGVGRDISVSGLFVDTADAKFDIGEEVRIESAALELPKPLAATAAVRRFNVNPSHPIGYGLSFVEIDNLLIAEIHRLVGVRPINEFGDVCTSYAAPKFARPS